MITFFFFSGVLKLQLLYVVLSIVHLQKQIFDAFYIKQKTKIKTTLKLLITLRSSHLEMFHCNMFLHFFGNSQKKHLCWSILFNEFAVKFIKRETLAQVRSCKFCKIFKSTYYRTHYGDCFCIQPFFPQSSYLIPAEIF